MDSAEEMVCKALHAATNANHEVVREAENQLQQWEQHQGFFITLARLCVVSGGEGAAGDVHKPDTNVRWMAAVYLKNGINKYWRRNTRFELAADEKQKIRQVLLENFMREPVPQVATQVAVLMGRIARQDCPRDWPDLVPQLMTRLKTVTQRSDAVDALEQHRLLLGVLHVVKALASRRMMAEKRMFEEFTANAFTFMHDVWQALTVQYFEQLKSDATMAASTMERALLALRTLRKFTMYGFAKPNASPECMGFLQEIFGRTTECLECRYELRRMRASEQLIGLLEKFIVKQMKTINEFQEIHSAAFVQFVPVALEFSFQHVFHEATRLIFDENVINFQNFAILCVNLMKGIMLTPVYEPQVDFFTPERLRYICEKIITHYFVLTQLELETWIEDPEDFAQDDGGESWRFALRPCVETFYSTCFVKYQTEMVDEVAEYIAKAQQLTLTPQSELKDILLKDAIYNAAGLTAHHFFHKVDFDQWFSEQLVRELRLDSSNFRILRRRIIWLLGEWAAVKFCRDLRPLAYEMCLLLLGNSEDMAIRLATSRCLSILIGEFEFMPEAFLPYLQPSFDALYSLLGDARECETKMNVLNIMSTIVEKMSDYIAPQAHKLIMYLPLLWKESECFNMLRCAILCTLQHIVKGIRDIPDAMRPFLYNVIQLSTNVNEPSYIYLIDEGLFLWLAVVENSTAMWPEMVELCKNLMPIVEMSSENLRTVLLIIQAYVLLDPRAYLDPYGRQFVDFCSRMFEDLRTDGIILMLKVFEIILKSEPNYGLQLLRPSLPYVFKQVYLNKDYPMLMSMYLMIVARVLLLDQSVFMSVVQEIDMPHAVETIMDVWLTKWPLTHEIEKRKLFSLAFCSIFSNNAVVLERFNGILQNIAETMMDVMREEEHEEADEGIGDEQKERPPVKYCDSLVFIDETDLDTSSYCIMDDFDYKTFHFDRCRQLALKDPVHKTVLPTYLLWQLNSLRQQMGEPAYAALMNSVYAGSLEKIGQFVDLNLPAGVVGVSINK